MESDRSKKGEFLRERRSLILSRNFILSKIDEATKRKERVHEAVYKWRDEAGKLLEESFKETGDAYFSDMILKMRQMNANRNFPFPKGKLLMLLRKDLLSFNSPTLEQLSEDLEDDDTFILGLYGPHGAGKTTLVKKVYDKAKEARIFNAVLFLTLCQDPNISMIEYQIVESLNLKSRSVSRNREKIKSELDGKNRILVILDDVPKKFDLESIGIARREDQQCKFLLTCHTQDFTVMIGEKEFHCQKMIPMLPLSDDDAWELLEKHLCLNDKDYMFHPRIQREVIKVVEACNKLPGTIIEFGSSLKGKTFLEWRKLAHSLRHSTARYHVFISFNGSDTGKTFTRALYEELTKEGFKTFMELVQISENPFNVIDDSRLSIVVLSPSYLSSSGCLDQLVHILECHETKKQVVWPIFYNLQPHQVDDCNLEETFENDSAKVEQWRSALTKVAQICTGWCYTESMSQSECIQEIIDSAVQAKVYLYVQSMEEKEWLNAIANHELEPFSTPTQGLESSSSRNQGSFTKEALKLLLTALEEDDLCFNSITLEELSKTLQDDTKNKIALHGKQGSGKTALVQVLRDKAKSLKIFDVVLFATVSQNPDILKIQDQIAESLNLKFDNEGESGRATDMKLSGVNRILVILDDVPAMFDPEKCIGIPCTDRRCKFLVTTRHKQDCTLMIGERVIHCQTMILMGPLSPEISWRLLLQHSGIEDDKSKLSYVANKIASKFELLPGSIIKIGSSLKNKPYKEWQGLLDSLSHTSARYHIFLSFRGTDTRDQFTRPLYEELKSKGFKTFMDVELREGDRISTELVKAIEDSRLSIVVLSQHYSNSSWCLDELVHILKCAKTKKQQVWPIFYKVEPTDVRHQTGDFGKAMEEVKEKFKRDTKRIEEWKSALFEVCQFTGRAYNEGITGAEFIQGIVERAIESKSYLYIQNIDME